MRSEFETLEQYQESMKEFNENTRMGFEEFIQSHGSDRNKLQLRCTPYTSKKGGYGSFDLDFGLCVYQHQQSKMDELQKRVDRLNSDINVQKEQLNKLDRVIDGYAMEVDELQKRVDAAFRVLSQLNALDDEAHKRWKREACMFSQSESNAYEHAVRLLEQALKGESNEI